jgi:hypothetical protein
MKVIRGLSTNKAQLLTAPFPATTGVFIELRGGDICHPQGTGEWFKPPYFARVFRAFCRWPICPFISWRFGSHGGYIGAKAYGVDSPAYNNWLPPEEVYDGSQAIMLSIRPFANLSGE